MYIHIISYFQLSNCSNMSDIYLFCQRCSYIPNVILKCTEILEITIYTIKQTRKRKLHFQIYNLSSNQFLQTVDVKKPTYLYTCFEYTTRSSYFETLLIYIVGHIIKPSLYVFHSSLIHSVCNVTIFPTTLMLRVSFSPAPKCVDANFWNRFLSTPTRGTRNTVVFVVVVVAFFH